ncbi:MAG: hypothetical protein AAF405_06790 [Pseudomonadota bacterium]
MIEIALIVLLALLAIGALFIWWRFDLDLSDLVASSVTPIVGVCLIYFYGGIWALLGGLALIAVGIFALVYLFRRRDQRAHRKDHYRDTP